MQGEDIRLREELLKREVVETKSACRFGIFFHIVGKDAHVKTARHRYSVHANVPCPNDTDGLALEVKAAQLQL